MHPECSISPAERGTLAPPARHDTLPVIVPLFEIAPRMPDRVLPGVWSALRWCTVAAAAGLILAGILVPALALGMFWGAFVPVAPLLFLAAPGIWRNTCPIATVNQLPRRRRMGRRRSLPAVVQRHAPLISAGLFVALLPLRAVLFERNGTALALFVLALLVLGFGGGLVFKGKSGWCSQLCPMLVVEHFYGRSPLLVARDSHCRPCVACTNNCYDFNPTAAHLADAVDNDSRRARYHYLVTGAMPWLIVAFFTLTPTATVTPLAVVTLYGRILAPAAVGGGLFFLMVGRTRIGAYPLSLVHVVIAFNLYYWFIEPRTLHVMHLGTPLLAHVALQAGIAALSAVWLRRALPRERAFRAGAFIELPQGPVRRRSGRASADPVQACRSARRTA